MKTNQTQFICFLFFLAFALQLNAQQADLQKYLVEFTDKNNSTYSVDRPEEYLGERAIERRKNQNIPLESSDFPINKDYLEGLESFVEEITHQSKWLNNCTVITEEKFIQKIERLPFVKSVKYIGKPPAQKLILRKTGKKRDNSIPEKYEGSPYGFSEDQNNSINISPLHQQNYRGKGILIAIFDGGFSNVDIMPFFDKARAEQRILQGFDFVENDDYVYEGSAHGSQVLSIIASDLPNIMVGTAPDASYICLKTEDSSGEYRSEELNWIAALEYADSVGVDIVNSSLGYTTFSDETMDYTYADMNGRTSLASCAADMAFKKGMIVVNSVGNEGNTPWKYLDAPADAFHVLAVGATDMAGYKTKFSSFGPTSDGRIKPEVCALGQDIAVASIYNTKVKATKGTSFSSPLIAGAIASLWQAVPHRSNVDIIEAVKLSAHRSHAPDNELGYGIPDFEKALELLK